ncbi:MAG: response regulator [Bdellovibrionia bacterium]
MQPCQKILVAEDDPSIREVLKESLEFEGYSVITAQNGKEAFELLNKMECCLVLLDLIMPIWDGFKFLETQAQSENLRAIPVIVVSAFPEKAANLNAVDFLSKPVKLSELFQKVKQYCGPSSSEGNRVVSKWDSVG